MAVESDTYTTGGSQPFCAISPSDLVTIQENWLSRIEALEKAVSALLAQNVSAGQISDISQQIGWVEGVTYMGIPGWTQTEVGTLIPPVGFSLSTSGFTMSDGSVWQGVLVDSDGVLQFGFGENGTIGGASTAGSSYLVCRPTSTTLTAFNQPVLSDIISERGSAFGTSNLSTGRIDILEAGYYHLDINLPVVFQTATPTAFEYMLVEVSNPELACKSGRDSGYNGDPNYDYANDNAHVSMSFECNAGANVQISFFGVVTLMGPATSYGLVNIEKLAGV